MRTTELPGLRFRNRDELRKHLGRRLRELRTARGYTQLELADASGVGQRQIQKLENGDGGGSLETWLDLSRTLDVPIEELFRRGTAMAKEPVPAYRVRARSRQQASEAQLDALLSVARAIDAKAVDGLIYLARRRKP